MYNHKKCHLRTLSCFREEGLKYYSHSVGRNLVSFVQADIVLFLGNTYSTFPIFSSWWRDIHDQTHITSLYTSSVYRIIYLISEAEGPGVAQSRSCPFEALGASCPYGAHV